jgi:hypothetical protein
MKTKSASQSAAKWSERAGNATGDYADGVQNPKQSWKDSTTAAQETWKQGLQTSFQNGSFARGVAKAGDAKQIGNSLSKGVSRFAAGVSIAQGDYETGVAPFLAIIERTTLPPRGPKGDPRNIERVSKLTTALHAGKGSQR